MKETQDKQAIKESTYTSAMLIANYAVKQCVKMELPLTNQTMQPLLYLMQVSHLQLYGTRLFEDDIEKRRFGPVVPSVHEAFAAAGCAELKRTRDEVLVMDFGESFRTTVIPYDKKRISKKKKQLVKGVLKKFTDWTERDLSVVTTALPGWQRDCEGILRGQHPLYYTLSDMREDLAMLMGKSLEN